MTEGPVRVHVKVTLDDGEVHIAGVDQRDYVRYDLTRARQGWPIATEAPFVFQAFTAAAALIRQGDVPDSDPAKLMLRIVDMPQEAEQPVRPTPPAAGGGSS